MKKVTDLEIKITRAVITQITWQMKGEKPQWYVTGELLTQTGRKVSEFTFYTSAWTDDTKIELPVIIDAHMAPIIEAVTKPVLEKLNGLTKELPEANICPTF